MFFIRDAAVVVLNLGQRRQRADIAAAFYLLVLYALLDAAFNVSLAGWLLPAVTGGFLLALAPAAVQAVLLWGRGRPALARCAGGVGLSQGKRGPAVSGSGSRTRR